MGISEKRVFPHLLDTLHFSAWITLCHGNRKREYISLKCTQYDCAKSRSVKGRIIDEVVQVLDVSRKYAIRLLTGKRVYRPSKGRGATYSEAAIKLMIEIGIS